jgi:hypothetical protein
VEHLARPRQRTSLTGESPAAALCHSRGTIPGITSGDDARRRAWNGSWNGAAAIPAQPVLSVEQPVGSVQLARSVDEAVVMVRRRSTIRFRNGAPGQGQFSNYSTGGVERARETLFSSHCSDSSHCTARTRRQVLKAAVGGRSRDSLVTVQAGAGRPAAGRFQASMSRIKIQDSPGGCLCHRARQAVG